MKDNDLMERLKIVNPALASEITNKSKYDKVEAMLAGQKKEMTHDEAIKWVRARLASGGSIDEAYRAGLIAIEAIKKATPKKPKGDLHSVPHYRCPTCNKTVKLYEGSSTYPYCKYCGQKLDWEV